MTGSAILNAIIKTSHFRGRWTWFFAQRMVRKS